MNITPIVDVAMLHASHDGILDNMDQRSREHVRSIFQDYLLDSCDFETCVRRLLQYTNNINSLDNLRQIKEVGDDPLPNHVPVIDQTKSRKKIQSWTKIEDNRLLAGILRYGLENWSSVSTFVGNCRTRGQCSQRWQRGLDPTIKRSNWTPEEEQKLLDLVAKYGEKAWMKIASEIGNRSDVQCRYHYLQMQKEARPTQPITIPKITTMPKPTTDSPAPTVLPTVNQVAPIFDASSFYVFDEFSKDFMNPEPTHQLINWDISPQASLADIAFSLWD